MLIASNLSLSGLSDILQKDPDLNFGTEARTPSHVYVAGAPTPTSYMQLRPSRALAPAAITGSSPPKGGGRRQSPSGTPISSVSLARYGLCYERDGNPVLGTSYVRTSCLRRLHELPTQSPHCTPCVHSDECAVITCQPNRLSRHLCLFNSQCLKDRHPRHGPRSHRQSRCMSKI